MHGQACELVPNAIHPICLSRGCPLPGLVLSVCPSVHPWAVTLGCIYVYMYIFYVRRAPPPALRNRRD